MSVGLLAPLANSMLAKMVADGYVWAKLHIGDPGANGTANPAAETTRKQVTWNTPAAGVMENTAALTWTGVAGSERYTYYSLWNASTGGTCGHTGLVSADAVIAGNNFIVPVGSLDVAFPLAA